METDTTTTATLEVDNGRVDGTITTAAPSAGTFECPSGQRRVLACVTYSNTTLTDTTNNVSMSIGTVSRTFVDIDGCP